jgi:hypothetical protein
MAFEFDPGAIDRHGWRQGAVLGPGLIRAARERAPVGLTVSDEVEAFWEHFAPAIECAGVEVLGTDELTLADIEPYQRFDADWVSFADDTASTPSAADMAS